MGFLLVVAAPVPDFEGEEEQDDGEEDEEDDAARSKTLLALWNSTLGLWPFISGLAYFCTRRSKLPSRCCCCLFTCCCRMFSSLSFRVLAACSAERCLTWYCWWRCCCCCCRFSVLLEVTIVSLSSLLLQASATREKREKIGCILVVPLEPHQRLCQ